MVINKIDRPDARPREVLNEIYDLFIDLDATEDQIDFPVLHERATGDRHHRAGWRGNRSPRALRRDRRARAAAAGQPTPACSCSAWPTSIRASLGRIAIGRIFNGRIRIGDPVVVMKLDATQQETKVTKLFAFDGLRRADIDEAAAGDIVCVAGIADITIGETVVDPEHREALPPTAIDEPRCR